VSVLIAGGGTGGHLYPGIAVARELLRRRPDAAVTFAGTAAGIEARVVPREGFTLDVIRSAGLKGKSLAAMELPATFGKPLRLVVADDVALPRLYLAFRSPIFGSDEYYAASVSSAILGMRRGSRLHRSLVRERQIAAHASAFTFDLAKGSDLLVADVMGRPETSPEKLEEEVGREIDRLAREGVTQAEVNRAVALIETDMVTALQSASERADRLSMFATYFGEPELLNEQSAKYRSVTAADVNEFAESRLGADNRATLLYVPKSESGDAAEKPQPVAA